MKTKRSWIWISGAIVLSLIVGLLIGSLLFPKTEIIEVSPVGKFCYDNRMVSQESYDFYKNLEETRFNEMKCYRDVASSSVQDLSQLKLNYCFSIMSPSEQTRCNQKIISYLNEENLAYNVCQSKY